LPSLGLENQTELDLKTLTMWVASEMWIRMMGQPMSELGGVCCLILLKRAAPINYNAGKTASNHKVTNIVYKT
jgi:hypothetical protein